MEVEVIDEENSPFLDSKERNPSVSKTIWTYTRMPKICDWLIVGVVIVCVIATIVLICI